MNLLTDITEARNTVQERANTLANRMRPKGYSYDNADTGKGWDSKFFAADKERLRQLDLLSTAIKDPSWTAKLDKEVDTRRTAGFAQADYGLRGAEDQRKTTGGASGTAGGSWDAVVRGQNEAEMARVKATVQQQVSELKAAGLQNLEEMGRQLFQKALAGPDEGTAMGTQERADQDQNSSELLTRQNDSQYRDLLANSLASVVQGGAQGVQMGFQSADRWNALQRDNYRDARDAGTYNGNFQTWAGNNGGTRSWW
jgi:hypothetical protein